MLVFLRLLQGISAGGEIASVTTYIIEVGNPRGLKELQGNCGVFRCKLWVSRSYVLLRVLISSFNSTHETNQRNKTHLTPNDIQTHWNCLGFKKAPHDKSMGKKNIKGNLQVRPQQAAFDKISGSLASSLVLIPATASLGSFVAQLVTFSLEGLLGDAAMLSWGRLEKTEIEGKETK